VKYLIVGHGDGNDGARVIVCETQEQRELQTIEEIYGENTFAGPSECPDIIVLRELKIVTFEGDPPLEWIDAADIVDAERDQLKAELAQASAHNAALLEACKEIAKGEGDFHRDPLVHAENTIQNMKQLARAAIALEKGEK